MIFCYNFFMKNFGNKIKELRKEQNLTQKDLANAINYAQSAINYWENDKQEPTISGLKALALFFGVTADYLLGLEDDFGNKIAPGKYTIQDSFNNNSGKIDIR